MLETKSVDLNDIYNLCHTATVGDHPLLTKLMKFLSSFMWRTRMYPKVSGLERELQMVQFPATRSSCIAILWVSLVSFVAITLCVASQRVFIIVVIVYFVIGSVRKLLDTPSYIGHIRTIIKFVWQLLMQTTSIRVPDFVKIRSVVSKVKQADRQT
jgi:hypothetical protein